MKTGIYDNISNEQYHSGPGISNSGLKTIRTESPLHYLAGRQAANDNEPTPALMLGTAFHALMLEPEVFTRTYTLGLRKSDYPEALDSRDDLVGMVEMLNKGRLPKISASGTKDELVTRIIDALPEEHRTDEVRAELQTNALKDLKANIENLNTTRDGMLSVSGTIPQLAAMLRDNGVKLHLWDELKAEWLANNGHRTVLSQEQWDQLHNMREATLAHPAARALLTRQGTAELSVYWKDKETGVLCRCRPDFWTGNILVDLKSTDDASPDGFKRSIAKFGYDTQDAFYQDGVAAAGKPAQAFVFIAVEKGARVVDGKPLGVGVYMLDEASRAIGRAKYRDALRTYADCTASGVWPCYGDKVETISLPQWDLSANAHLLERVA